MHPTKSALPLCLITATTLLSVGCTSSIQEILSRNSSTQTSIDIRKTDLKKTDTKTTLGQYSLIKADNNLLDAINKVNDDAIEQVINQRHRPAPILYVEYAMEVALPEAAVADSSSQQSTSYSQTNLIENNVDEPDFVKQTAHYIFLYGHKADNNAIKIYDKLGKQTNVEQSRYAVNQDPIESSYLQAISSIDIADSRTLEGLFLTTNELYTLSLPNSYQSEPAIDINSYNISNIESPKLDNTTTINGILKQSRKLNDDLIVVTDNHLNIQQNIDCDGDLPHAERMTKWDANPEEAIAQCQAKYRLSEQDLLKRMPKDINGEAINPSDCYISHKSDNDSASFNYQNLTLIHKLDLVGTHHQTICIATNTDGFYMSDKAIYFASTSHKQQSSNHIGAPNVPDTEFVESGVTMPYPITTTQSDIHKFDLTGNHIDYVGTGRVDGSINADVPSFSMNEYQGILRIATSGQTRAGIKNMLHTLKESEDTLELITLATLPNKANPQAIGKPHERIKGVRFMGNQGYIVTFKNADPLYKIDLTNPANPKMMGELEMPGYSAYLHKINDNYLMGIGYTVNERAQPIGIQTTLFDVTKAPKIVSQDTVAIKDGEFQPSFQLMIDTDSKALSTVYDKGMFKVTIPYFQGTVNNSNEHHYATQTKALEYEIDLKTAEFINRYRRDGQKLHASMYDQPRFRALIDGNDVYYTTDDGTINKYEWGKP